MGCICARQAPDQTQSQHSSHQAGAAWSPRAPDPSVMATHRPLGATPQPLVRPSRSGIRDASRSDSFDDEIGADFGGRVQEGRGSVVSQHSGGHQASLAGSASSSFPHLVAIQHLRSQKQAETAALAATTPKGQPNARSKKLALLGGGNRVESEAARGAVSPDEHPDSTQPPPPGQSIGDPSASGTSHTETPRRKDKKEKRDHHDRDGKRKARKTRREKQGGSLAGSQTHCDPSYGGLPPRGSSLADSTSSFQSSSVGSALAESGSFPELFGGGQPSTVSRTGAPLRDLDLVQ